MTSFACSIYASKHAPQAPVPPQGPPATLLQVDQPVHSTAQQGFSRALETETKNYRIRLQKLDNENVVMAGSLASDALLQDLAYEIVCRGHAQAGSFCVFVPAHLGRPATAYAPSEFDVSLESCGLFQGSVAVKLQCVESSHCKRPEMFPTSFAQGSDHSCPLYNFGFDRALTARALIQANGDEDLAANLLLNGQVQDRVSPPPMDEPPQPDQAQQPELVAAPDDHPMLSELKYCRFFDEFLGRSSLRLQTPQVAADILRSCHYVHRTFDFFQTRARQLLLRQPIRFELAAAVGYSASESARVRVCSSGIGAHIAVGLAATKFKQDNPTAAKCATLIMSRVCNGYCSRIQVNARLNFALAGL